MERAFDASKIRSLIVVRPDRVGDVVISTSCLAPIKEKFPDAKIHFVAAELMRPLLEKHLLLAGFISLDANLENEFRRVDAQAVIHLHPDEKCYAAARSAGILVRVGYALGSQNDYLTHTVNERRQEGRLHEAQYNFDLLKTIGLTLPSKLTGDIYLPHISRASLQNKLPWQLEAKRFAVIHPSAHSKIVRWPIERFLQLADRFETEFGLSPVFVGDDLEAGIHDSRHLNLIGKTDPAELGWLLNHAAVLVTRSSGPSHIAAAVGCPVVALFGGKAPAYGPVRWRPLSEMAISISKPLPRRFWEGHRIYWKRCLAAITVGEVADAAKQLVAVPRAPGIFRTSTTSPSVV